jgi:Tfp pilus assembly protein PilN
VSQSLYQQINLYQPIFRRQKQVFSGLTMLQSTAVIAVALLTIHLYGVFHVVGLEAQAIELEGRERAYSTQLASIDPTATLATQQSLAGELARLNQQILDQQRLIDVLRNEPPGRIAGFSSYLEALALSVKRGIWLTELSVNGATEAVELLGRATSADLVPTYLQLLGEQDALQGQAFDQFRIERNAQESGVSFYVTSEAVGLADQGGSSQR